MININRRGFSLIELMVVIAIVALLAAVAIPAYKSYITKAAFSSAHAAINNVLDKSKEYYMSEGIFASAEDLGFDDGGSGSTVVDPQTAVQADISTIDISRTYFEIGCPATAGVVYAVISNPNNIGKDVYTYYLTYDLNGTVQMECGEVMVDTGAAYPAGNPELGPGITCPSSIYNEDIILNATSVLTALVPQLCP